MTDCSPGCGLASDHCLLPLLHSQTLSRSRKFITALLLYHLVHGGQFVLQERQMMRIRKILAMLCGTGGERNSALSFLYFRTRWLSLKSPSLERKLASVDILLCASSVLASKYLGKTIVCVSIYKSHPPLTLPYFRQEVITAFSTNTDKK